MQRSGRLAALSRALPRTMRLRSVLSDDVAGVVQGQFLLSVHVASRSHLGNAAS